MTKSTRDIPSHEGSTVADRIKAARQNAELTRKALAAATGIPASTLEKYERGDMDPNTTRLQTMCDHLGVTVNWMLNGDHASEVFESVKPVTENQLSAKVTEFEETAETLASTNDAETSTVISTETFFNGRQEGPEAALPANENDPMAHVQGMLIGLDDMRSDEFDGVQRGATALVDDIRAALKHFEAIELLTLAHERDLYQGECESADSILDMFRENADKAQSYCGSIEERIIDTAILGVDLHNLDRKALVNVTKELSDEHGFDTPNFFGWGEHTDFIPLIRPHLRALAIYNDGYNLEDIEAFPKRETPADKGGKTSLEELLGL